MTIEEAQRHIGAGVIYRGGASSEDETGVITSVNATYVFVRYAGDGHSKATAAQRLEFLSSHVDGSRS